MSKVTLVGITQPLIEGVSTACDLVAYVARVSNPSNQLNTETAPKLLAYLAKHQHWSPFEMVSMTMEIETTRDIARQILRHRSFSFQEFSQRYAHGPDLGFETREARLQDAKNRQASNELDMATDTDRNLAFDWERAQKRVLFVVQKEYEWAIKNGIAKEQARAILPEGLTHSRLYMAGTLRSWLHYCILRTEMGTQKEHREVAQAALDIIAQQFPSIMGIVTNENGSQQA